MIYILINFQKIKLHNFFSFSDAELELNDMGYTIVSGRNYCKIDGAFSNGSGKSSIFNGICFALTGETAQGVSMGVGNIFTDPEDCWVELTFKVDNDEFILKRYRNPWHDLKIFINGEDKSGKGVRESTKLLYDYLPELNPSLINSIIILGQGLPNRFTNNNPAQRKEILEKLTKSDFMIQSIKDKLDLRKTELQGELRSKEDKSLEIRTQVGIFSQQLKTCEDNLKSFEEFDNSEITLGAKITSVEEELNDVTSKITYYMNLINEKNESLEHLTTENNNYILNSQTELNNLLSPYDNDISKYSAELITLKAEISALKKEIKRLENITDICPTCGQKIPESKKPDVTVDKEKLSKLETQANDIKLNIDTIVNDRNVAEKNYNDNKIIILNRYEAEIIDVKTKIRELNLNKENLLASQLSLSQTVSKLMALKDSYSKLIGDINNYSNKIDELNKLNVSIQQEMVEVNSHLDIIQQLITIAKRDFRGILLLNVIEYINKKVKQYSEEVFGSEELEFKLNENAIDISYCEKPYENLSGGERQKIDIIVQLALRDLLSKQLNIHSNLLVCDEIFDNLDTQGCNKIMNLISNLTDIDSVFIISHHTQDLELTKDNEILVEKNELGISSIKFV